MTIVEKTGDVTGTNNRGSLDEIISGVIRCLVSNLADTN